MGLFDWLFNSTVPGAKAVKEMVKPTEIPEVVEAFRVAKKEMDIREAEHQKKVNTIMGFHIDNRATVGERIMRAANHGRATVEISLHELKFPDTFFWKKESWALLEKMVNELKEKGYRVEQDLKTEGTGEYKKFNVFHSKLKIIFSWESIHESAVTEAKSLGTS